MRDLFDKEFQKEMDDFFDYIDHEVLGKPREDDDYEEVSDCCGEEVYDDYDICSSCNDHCGREEAEI